MSATAEAPVIANVHHVDMLHSVPFDISGYPEAQQMPEKFTKAEQVLEILGKTKQLLVHMEAIRRGSLELPPSEKEKLSNAVHERYFANENDVIKFFDNGYTQLVVKNNKSGLFFLRKANDKLANQFTSLAYALGQVDVDINHEQASPGTMTFRKLDVTYKLTDAVARDAKAHQPGFWPTLNKVMDRLNNVGALHSFAQNDFSSSYVPFGSELGGVTGEPRVKISQAESTATPATGDAASATCEPAIASAGEIAIDLSKAFRTLPVRLGNTEGKDKAYFFQTGDSGRYRVLVLNGSNQLLADFISPLAPYIVEDIDGDGVDELVVRQFLLNRDEPVKVYRFAPSCGFQHDKSVANFFK